MQPSSTAKLGTFAGVFTPSILTILGIILFLRVGYVIGNAGLFMGMIIIMIANSISILTSFSLSAIATNMKVKKGGDYYLISRTLGVEFGGSIGIVLFLAQSISIAFYCLGFGEVINGFIPSYSPHQIQIISGTATIFLFVLAWIGADLATKFQYIVMAFLVMALFSFYTGGFARWDTSLFLENLQPFSGNTLSFWVLFALFFPAVTGFTQGVSMSGDLQNASKSLPVGTFLAVGVSILVYISVAVTFAASTPGEVLATDYTAMKYTSRWAYLIDTGVIAATLSSAMASFLGAPRILQSLASDRVFPALSPFSTGAGPGNNPRRGTLLSLVIALIAISFGKLDIIAPVVTMFFLISYGLLNYATFYEARSTSPSFRPTFRLYHPLLSLAGSIICFAIMVAIDYKTAVIAISILFATLQYTKRTAGPARWADGQRSYFLQKARASIKAASIEIEHPRDWRPYILAVSNNPVHRGQLLKCASWLEGDSGMTAVAEVIQGSRSEMIRVRSMAQRALQKEIRIQKSDAYPLVIAVDDKISGYQALIQSWGIGPMRANTILMNWHDNDKKNVSRRTVSTFEDTMAIAYRFGLNLTILSTELDISAMETAPAKNKELKIDVWWHGDSTAKLALLYAYLLTRHSSWENAEIRVIATNYQDDSANNMASLGEALDDARINATKHIIKNAGVETLINYSRDAAIVFLPFTMTQNQPATIFNTPLDDILPKLSLAITVCAAENFDLGAEPEEGKFEEIVTVIDNVHNAQIRLENARKRVADLTSQLEKQNDADDKSVSPPTPVENSSVLPVMSPGEKELDRALRLVIRQEALLERALKEADNQGIRDAFT